MLRHVNTHRCTCDRFLTVIMGLWSFAVCWYTCGRLPMATAYSFLLMAGTIPVDVSMALVSLHVFWSFLNGTGILVCLSVVVS